MIRTAGLQLSNFLNPDLTWKTVSKGNRSATRRTRKACTRNLMVGMEIADDSRKRAEDTTVSESEKLGRRFNGKVEHVPIKKRRFNFRSPSPPPRNQSDGEVVRHVSSPNLNENKLLLAVGASSEVDGKISDSVNEKHDYREDFSGIEMLADAACNNSFDADVGHPEENPLVEESLQEEKDSAMPADVGHREENPLVEEFLQEEQDTAMPADVGHPEEKPLVEECLQEEQDSAMPADVGHPEDKPLVEESLQEEQDSAMPADVGHPEEKPRVKESLQEEKDSAMPMEEKDSAMPMEEKDSALPMEETVASLETCNEPRNMLLEDRVEGSTSQDTSTDAQSSSSQGDNKIVEMAVPRLHWDLNVVMDAWEQPCDTLSVPSQIKDVESTLVVANEKLHALEDYETEREIKDVEHNDMVDSVVSSEVHEETHTSSDLKGSSYGLDREDNQLGASSHLDRNCDESSADPKASPQVLCSNPITDSLTCSNNVASNTSLHGHLEEKTECCASGVQEDEIVFGENVQLEKGDVASTCVPALDRVTCDVERSMVNEDSEECALASSLQNDINALQEMVAAEHSELHKPSSHGVELPSKVEEVDVSHPSSKCEDLATCFESIQEVQPVSGGCAEGEMISSLHVQSDKLMHMSSDFVTAKMDTGGELGSIINTGGELGADIDAGCEMSAPEESEAHIPTNNSCKIGTEEPCDDIYESDTSQDDKDHIDCMENELQDGYDSQFEDGELRDPNVHCWEENTCDGAEIEQVDYESECEGERLSILEAEDAENKRKLESGSSQGSGDVTEKSGQCAIGDAFRDSLTSSEVRTSQAADGGKIKKHAADCEDYSNGKDMSSQVVGSRTALPSDVLLTSRSNNFDDLCPRSEREADSNRFMERGGFASHTSRRSPGGGHIVDTRQSPPCHGPYGSERPRPRSIVDSCGRRKYMSSSSNVYRTGGHIFNTRQSPSYSGPYGSGRPRPRSVIESREFGMASDCTMLEATGVEGFDSRVRRPMNSSSNSAYELFDTRQSPPYHGPYGSGRGRPRSVIESREFGMASDRTIVDATGVEGFDSRVRRPMNSSSNSAYELFNTRQSPLCHGPYGSGRARPRSVVESREFVMASDRPMLDATGVDGFDSHVRRPVNSSSNSAYRSLNRRSLAYRDDIYAGTTAVRDDISPDRSRFRRYALRDDGRGMPNYPTDDHLPHRLGRRERSISPLGGERLHCAQLYKKPQSRSRSRSPNGWFMVRERNEGSRRRSRSPTFRSARINNRVRLPYNKKRSDVEYEEGFMSPPRNRFSPQCNSRFDDRMSGLDNLRDRRSPVRMFRQGQRFDSVRSIRPMMHPNRRFGEMGGTGRGCKYEGGGDDDDRRKQGHRSDMIDRVRRYDTSDGSYAAAVED